MSIHTESKKQSKDIIAREALKLFVNQGYHHTSIPDIVKAAGLSTGSVYHHFHGKEQLARYIHDLASKEFTKRFNAKVKTKELFCEQLNAFVRMMFEWDDEDPVMVKYLITDRPVEILNRPTTVCSEGGMSLIGEMVSNGMTSQQLNVDNYFMAISLISGSIIHFVNLKNDGFVQGDLSSKADDFAKHITRSLCREDCREDS